MIYIYVLVNKKSINTSYFSFVLFGVLFLAWIVYGSDTFLVSKMSAYVKEVMDFDLVFQKNVSSRVQQGSLVHSLTASTKIAYSLLFWIIGFAGFVSAIKNKYFELKFFKLLSLLALSPFFLLFMFTYGGELYIRMFFFSLIFTSCFMAIFLKNKKNSVIIAIVILFIPLRIVAQYGNEMYDYIPKNYLMANNFVIQHIDKASITGGLPIGKVLFAEKYTVTHQTMIKWDKIASGNFNSDYAIIGPRDKIYQTLAYGNKDVVQKSKIALLDSTSSVCVYQNNDIDIFYCQR
jgi:hypothetical protein